MSTIYPMGMHPQLRRKVVKATLYGHGPAVQQSSSPAAQQYFIDLPRSSFRMDLDAAPKGNSAESCNRTFHSNKETEHSSATAEPLPMRFGVFQYPLLHDPR
jgi:hypothetical protein